MTITIARSPWDIAHGAHTWRYDAHDGSEVTAHFGEVHGPEGRTDGATFLRGYAVDEYGWWHAPATIDPANVRNFHAANGYPNPEPAPFAATPTFEWRRHLIRLVIPDDVARKLAEWKREHWIEIPGVAAGYTPPARRGTWAHRTMAFLHSIASHLTDTNPFVQGESFESMRDEHGHATAGAYDLFVSTYGVCADISNPARGFHFQG